MKRTPSVVWMLALCVGLPWGCGADEASVLPEKTATSEATGPPEETRIGLALSGGGYRATIHGLAALKALDKRELLGRVEIVSGVSGGSLAGAYYVYRRARDGDGFQFASFEADLLEAVSNYEVPRSVVAAELQDATSGVTKAFSQCVANALTGKAPVKTGETSPATPSEEPPTPEGGSAVDRLLRLGEKVKGGAEAGLAALKSKLDASFDGVVNGCVDEAMIHVKTADLGLAITAYTGDKCPVDVDPWMRSCLEGEERGVEASVNNALVGLILMDKGVRGDIQRTYCHPKRNLCDESGVSLLPRETGKAPPHPLSELMHLALFRPWNASQGAVHLGDLVGIRPQLVVNATSTDQGDLWSATATGAGIRQRVRDEVPPSWIDHGEGRGPRLSDAVAASACYPLFCRPVVMPGPNGTRDLLTDGGIFDNLGVRGLVDIGEDGASAPNLVIVADAHRPYEPVDETASRTGTVLRLIDMLMEQRSQGTLEHLADHMEKTAREGGHGICKPVHVTLARAKESVRLGSLPTDLRPIEATEARALLEESTALFLQQLDGHMCLQ